MITREYVRQLNKLPIDEIKEVISKTSPEDLKLIKDIHLRNMLDLFRTQDAIYRMSEKGIKRSSIKKIKPLLKRIQKSYMV